MTDLPELMTVKEVREYLGCSNATVYDLIKQNNFPAFKIGNAFKIRKEDFISWINNQKIN